MGLSPYNSMGNNPISNIDPNGDSPLLIGAAIGFLSNGIQNVASGNNFFSGGLKAAFMGAWGGGVSSGIGAAFGNVSGFGNELLRAGAHGVSGGLQSMAGGGSFGSGFLSGSISSGVGSGISALGGGASAQWAGGGLSGGIGSVIGGGNFFQGVGTGLMVGGLNHAVNHLLSGGWPPKNGDPNLIKMAEMMADRTGGDPWDYYNAMMDDNFVGDRVNKNTKSLLGIFGLIIPTPFDDIALLRFAKPYLKNIPRGSNYKQVVKVLKKEGWKFVRNGKGSHRIWESPGGNIVPIPDHGSKSVSIGIINLLNKTN